MGFNRGYRYRERVGAADSARTLLEHLAQTRRHSSQEVWEGRIDRGEVRLEGRIGRASDRLRPGDEIEWDRPPWEEPAVPRCCAVLYRDDDLLVVAKPRGLPTLPSGGFLDHTLLALVRGWDASATPMHRLGRGTSGLVVFARTKRARSFLARAWREGEVDRIYRGLVEGLPRMDAFSVDARIGRVPHPLLGSVYGASQAPDARKSRTDVSVLERRRSTSLVEVDIATGRPDQIRIHLASAGHPLVDDPLYGPGGLPCSHALPGDGGYWLHAMRIAFPHPVSGRPVVVECEPPPRLRRDG